jgi:hypothetical protein
MLDMVVDRRELKPVIAKFLRVSGMKPAAVAVPPPLPPQPAPEEPEPLR